MSDQDLLMRSIQEGLRIAAMEEEEKILRDAVERLQKKLREQTATMAMRLLSEYDVRSDGRHLTISVKLAESK